MKEREKLRIENVELLCPQYSCLGWPSPGVIVIMKFHQIFTKSNDKLPLAMTTMATMRKTTTNTMASQMKSTMPHTMTIAMDIIMMKTMMTRTMTHVAILKTMNNFLQVFA